MTMSALDLVGMPYSPGFAMGTLRRGTAGARAQDIVLLDPFTAPPPEPRPAGLIVVEGAPFSHAMIGLLGYGVPTVIVTAQQAAMLVDGMSLWMDAVSGRLGSDPSSRPPVPAPPVDPPPGRCVHTADGTQVSLRASVRSARAVRRAVERGAESIGLVRSEFLLPDAPRPPDAAAYGAAFAEVFAAARPLPVTVRVLDVAVDKRPPWLPSDVPMGNALGMQGVRLYVCEAVRGVVDAQLAAIATLDEVARARLLIPYLVRLEELDFWVERVRSQLPADIPIGAMVESPAAALDASHWLERVEFVALGCNDLMQCLFAADRDQPALRHYLDAYAPLLYRLLRQVADGAGKRVGRIQLCGVLSQLPGTLPVLLGLGYRVFSVDADCIPWLAKTVTACRIGAAETLAAQVCAAQRTREVLELLDLPADRHAPFLH